jgi:hypothetical protein
MAMMAFRRGRGTPLKENDKRNKFGLVVIEEDQKKRIRKSWKG